MFTGPAGNVLIRLEEALYLDRIPRVTELLEEGIYMHHAHSATTLLLVLSLAGVYRPVAVAAQENRATTHPRSTEGETVIWSQDDFSTSNSLNISDFVLANDFALSEAVTILTGQVWLSDDEINNNGSLDSFSGILGWAIYTEGSNARPATLIAKGQDETPEMGDAGSQDDYGADIVKVTFELSPGVTLQPGRYWLAIHEGPWRSASDGSIVWWVETRSGPKGYSPVGDNDPTNPTYWDLRFDDGGDLAFTLSAEKTVGLRTLRFRVGPRRAEPVGR